MPATRPNLFSRPDTLFGVCEGLGEETGLPPIVLRIAFALPLIFAPLTVIGVYLALGITLMTVRWLMPPVRQAEPAAEPAAPAAHTPPAAGNDDVALVRAA